MKKGIILMLIAILMLSIVFSGCTPSPTPPEEDTDPVIAPSESESATEIATEHIIDPVTVPDDPTVPVFSIPGGIYSEAGAILRLTCDSSYTIRYTTDGNEPTNASELFTNDIAPFDGQDSLTVRAACFNKSGARVGRIVTQTYILNRDGRFDGIAVVALTVNESDLYGTTGIFTHPTSSGKEWERPAHVEISIDGQRVIDQDCGIRLFGGSSRILRQKSFRIIARRDDQLEKMGFDSTKYDGKGSFAYAIFDGRTYESGEREGETVDKYDRLILRNGGNDSLLNTAVEPLGMTGLRDNIANSFMASVAPNVAAQNSRMAIVFFNGEYYGVLDLKEDINDNYIRNIYGLPEKKDITVIKSELDATRSCGRHNANDCRFCGVWFYYEVDEGDESELSAFTSLCKKAINAAGGSREEEIFEELSRQIDMQNLIEYFVVNLYLCNNDWPHNNVRIWRYTGGEIDGIEITDGKWRFATRDMDFVMGRYVSSELPEMYTAADCDTFARVLSNYWSGASREGIYPDSLMLQGLLDFCLRNDGFRADFEAYCKELVSDENKALLKSLITEAADSVRGEMQYHISEWTPPINRAYDVENWEDQVELMLEWVDERAAYFLKYLNNAMKHYN